MKEGQLYKNDLRVKNYVFNIIHDCVTQISDPNEINDILLFNPIPLTEEWLIRFGFEKNSKNNYYHDKLNYLYQSGNVFLDDGNDSGWSVGLKIEYVHQLQNLHFGLTGEELTIKL